MKPCTFPDCRNLARYGTLCSGHEKQRNLGKPLTPLKPMRIVKMFVHNCVGNRRRDTGCWTDWPYAVIKKSGRPVMNDPTRKRYAALRVMAVVDPRRAAETLAAIELGLAMRREEGE